MRPRMDGTRCPAPDRQSLEDVLRLNLGEISGRLGRIAEGAGTLDESLAELRELADEVEAIMVVLAAREMDVLELRGQLDN